MHRAPFLPYHLFARPFDICDSGMSSVLFPHLSPSGEGRVNVIQGKAKNALSNLSIKKVEFFSYLTSQVSPAIFSQSNFYTTVFIIST